jgi:hypothetical protein
MNPSIIRAFAASALLVCAATAANAQSTVQSGAAAATPSAPWAKVPAGVYKLEIALPDQVMPATITVKDSSGAAVATFQPEMDQEAHPVKVTVKSTELYVNGEAPKGPFEIVLLHQGAEITGRWSYGGDNGKLTGKIQQDITK